MSKNKHVKEELIRRYGPQCFIEKLKLRDTRGLKYTGKAQYKRMKMLTYHHIRMKKDGGKATVENGALLSNENHIWFHQQPQRDQEVMNEMFQQLKKKYDKCKIELVDELDTEIEVHATLIEPKDLLRRARQKQLRKEKRELQRLKKEWEDR